MRKFILVNSAKEIVKRGKRKKIEICFLVDVEKIEEVEQYYDVLADERVTIIIMKGDDCHYTKEDIVEIQQKINSIKGKCKCS